MLGGVAAGIAKTYRIDLALVRILWIIAAVAWIGVPAYIVAWIAIPKATDGDQDDERDMPRDFGILFALGLIGLGLLVAIHQIFPGAWHAGRVGGPLLLIAAGVAILIVRRPSDEADEADEADAVEAEAPVAAPTEASEPRVEESQTQEDAPASAWTQTEAWPTPPTRDERRTERRRRRRTRPRPFLTPVALSVLLIGAGVTGLLEATDTVAINLTIAFGIGTIFVGGVLLLSAWFGRAYGLIPIGVLLALLTVASSAIDVPLRGGVGERIYRPTKIEAVQGKYELAVGHLVVDLRKLEPSDVSTDSTMTLGVGDLEVDVPTTYSVHVDARTGAGSIDIFGNQTNGWRAKTQRNAPGTTQGEINLHLHVGAGHIEVRRFDNGNETLTP
jgi:phage shock protein PspC (stress-responsive transcriptional regulator)